MTTSKKTDLKGRVSRTPINGPKNIMTVSGIDEEKFHPCWVNDIDDNINKYLDAGYEFVLDDGSIRVGDRALNRDSQIGTKVAKNVGNNVTAYLMVVPKEYYEEDMKRYHDEIDQNEREWQTGQAQSVEGSYGSVKISKRANS